jgi:hypothetical protein
MTNKTLFRLAENGARSDRVNILFPEMGGDDLSAGEYYDIIEQFNFNEQLSIASVRFSSLLHHQFANKIDSKNTEY